MKLTYASIVLLCLLSLLSGCSTKKKIDENIVPAQTSYDHATSLLEEKKYTQAADAFETIFFQHPGHKLTALAELMQSYSLYLAKDYDIAIDVLQMFITLHPRHDYIAYAYYMKALCSYVQISSIKLDQSRTEDTKIAFEKVISRFPDTEYATDAKLKLHLVDNYLAAKHMLVGRYYLNKNNPISAIGRFQAVISQYPHTTHMPEALYRMVEVNLILGLEEEAYKYAAALKINYPDGAWFILSNDLLQSYFHRHKGDITVDSKPTNQSQTKNPSSK